jgi:predicted DNA binding CopG/RHH family protein
MRKEYDFSRSRRNPYAKQLKRQITIRLDTMAIDYFKRTAAELGMPYQNLINLFLRDCAIQKRRPSFLWLEGLEEQPVRR